VVWCGGGLGGEGGKYWRGWKDPRRLQKTPIRGIFFSVGFWSGYTGWALHHYSGYYTYAQKSGFSRAVRGKVKLMRNFLNIFCHFFLYTYRKSHHQFRFLPNSSTIHYFASANPLSLSRLIFSRAYHYAFQSAPQVVQET